MATLRTIWDELVKGWVVVLSLLGVVGMGIGVYYQVLENTKTLAEVLDHMATLDRQVQSREVDVLQWQKIGDARDRIVVLETWRQRIDSLTDPQEIQEWGIVKQTVRRTEQRLDEHLRGHP